MSGHATRTRAAWSAERADLLVRHYHAGLSAAESAQLIGATSKSAVISKRRRLGLVATVEYGGRPEQLTQASGSRDRLRSRPWRGPPPMPIEPLPQMDGSIPLYASPARLAALPPHACLWPLGPAEDTADHATLFCGAPKILKSSYCAAHAARARRSTSERAPCA